MQVASLPTGMLRRRDWIRHGTDSGRGGTGTARSMGRAEPLAPSPAVAPGFSSTQVISGSGRPTGAPTTCASSKRHASSTTSRYTPPRATTKAGRSSLGHRGRPGTTSEPSPGSAGGSRFCRAGTDSRSPAGGPCPSVVRRRSTTGCARGVGCFPAEMITDDAARVTAGGPEDIVLTHDSRDAPWQAPAVAGICATAGAGGRQGAGVRDHRPLAGPVKRSPPSNRDSSCTATIT